MLVGKSLVAWTKERSETRNEFADARIERDKTKISRANELLREALSWVAWSDSELCDKPGECGICKLAARIREHLK